MTELKPCAVKTIDIEIAVASYFDYRQNLVVPNISWGLNIHECDLFIISQAGYATEVEIKISKSDLKKDAGKYHGHRSDLIKKLYFALPEKLEAHIKYVPERAGIIILTRNKYGLACKIIRKPKPNKASRKLTDEERYKVARLGALRIWGLKHTIISLNRRAKGDEREMERLSL